MADSFIVRRHPAGAAAALFETGKAVNHGEISQESVATILKAARLESGTIDPKAVDAIEALAKQLTSVSTALRTTAEYEALPVVSLTAFLPQVGEADRALTNKAHSAVNTKMPLRFTTAVTVIATRPSAEGVEAVVAVHNCYFPPTRADAHFVVAVPPTGLAKATKVRIETGAL